MKEPVVCDSTCLIGLERVGKIDILPALFAPIMIPLEVERESSILFQWLQTVDIKSTSLVTALQLVVDAGEAEAIALASEIGCLLITDDKQARSTAKQLGVRVIGTVGVLVRAKQNGLIRYLKPILEQLESNSFYTSKALREEALKLVGE